MTATLPNSQVPGTNSNVPSGPGGSSPPTSTAHPNEWWKMLAAMGIGAGFIWAISTMFSEDAAKWTAVLTLLAIVTYYETHGNHQFSNAIQSTFGAITSA